MKGSWFIFARGETPDAVEAALRAAHRCLSFEIAPEIAVTRVARPAQAGQP